MTRFAPSLGKHAHSAITPRRATGDTAFVCAVGYIIGYQRCQYADVFNEHRGNMLKQGILRLDGTPYPDLESGLKAMNNAILSEWQAERQDAPA